MQLRERDRNQKRYFSAVFSPIDGHRSDLRLVIMGKVEVAGFFFGQRGCSEVHSLEILTNWQQKTCLLL